MSVRNYSLYFAVSCNDGDLRLVGGEEAYEGRVEVCFSGVWGTVCDDVWNSLNAEVVCNELGLNFSGKSTEQHIMRNKRDGKIHNNY